jgi:hypothetical protein
MAAQQKSERLNMKEIGSIIRTKYGQPERVVFNRRAAGLKASLAMEIMYRLALVHKPIAEEDTAGRQKSELLSPAELADRAIKIADRGIDEMLAKDWFIDLPDVPADD